MGLFLLGCGAGAKQSESKKYFFDKYGSREAFLHAVENGDADADAFVDAIKEGPLKFTDVSPEALANYLEAFANKGMLKLIPFYFFNNEEMIVSLDTVFEDPENTSNNWEVYREHTTRL
ncbi:MAG: hypothetical protein JSW15_01855 [Deltaproteobacteria bacterium]|nr:MAG: hypothetical protein JSW15_01855 [Deltaproteobacteria bacterium]